MQEENLNDKKDRREFERFKIRMTVKLLDLTTNKESTAYSHDISANGIGLVSSEKLGPQAPLELWLYTPDNHEPICMKGHVVWSKSINFDSFRLGINLESPDLMGLSRILRSFNPSA